MAAQAPGAPYGVLLAVAVGLMVAGPIRLSDPTEIISEAISSLLAEIMSEAISGLLGPAGRLLFPVALLLFIRFLSSGPGIALSQIFNTGDPDSIHRIGGSPVGVALVILLLLLLLYNRVSLFGSGDDDSGQ